VVARDAAGPSSAEPSNAAGAGGRSALRYDFGIALIHGKHHLPHLKQGFMSSNVTA
jgi:hypothetical protein